ncbi:hypothetical protein ACFLYU_01665 [Candidatus Dependentiae bacterium]
MSGKEKKEENNRKFTGSKKLQLILLFTFSVILLWVLAKPLSSFTSTDEYPTIVPMTPQKIISFGGSPSTIIVGLYVRDIPQANFATGDFFVNLTVWFKFNPILIPLDRINKFSFDNTREIKHKSGPYTRIEGDELLASYDMRVKFSIPMNYQNFPFDDHKINFSLTNYHLSPSEAIFKSSKSNFMINEDIKLAGWEQINKWVKTGFIKDTLNPHDARATRFHPRAVFSIDISRAGIRHVITILIPLILIFFIAVFTLAFNPSGPDAGSIIGISVASISAVIAHRFVIESMSPKSGSFMISDKLFFLFLTSTCAIFFINIFSRKISGFYKNMLAILLYIFTFISTTYILSPLF